MFQICLRGAADGNGGRLRIAEASARQIAATTLIPAYSFTHNSRCTRTACRPRSPQSARSCGRWRSRAS